MTVGFHGIKWSGYANDLVLFFENISDMKKATQILYETFCNYGLEINKSKQKL